jgi:hypothetical protein
MTKSKNTGKKGTPGRIFQDVEGVVQARIQGLTYGEIGKRYGIHRNTASEICEQQADAIQKGRETRNAERQEIISRVLQDDVKAMATVMSNASVLVEEAQSKLLFAVKKKTLSTQDKEWARFYAIVAKAFGAIRGAGLNQQKEAPGR